MYNISNVWDPAYNPAFVNTTGATTTTLQIFDFSKCPKCEVCRVCEDCSVYVKSVGDLNFSLDQCKTNEMFLRNRNDKMYTAESYDQLAILKGAEIQEANGKIRVCSDNLSYSNSQIGTYQAVAFLSVGILVLIVAVWVKYEWIGDPKIKDGFKVDSKG
jgi:hypothetical protein